LCRYGTPDPDLIREYDVRVKLTMSSVWYVHTQHFMQETFAFIQNFNKLQDILGRSRAVASGKKVGTVCALYKVAYCNSGLWVSSSVGHYFSAFVLHFPVIY